jgi:UDP-N-acetylglucosamine enolpyruvyl transferase
MLLGQDLHQIYCQSFWLWQLKQKEQCLFTKKCLNLDYSFVDKLIDMGAQIILCDPHRATVVGLNHEYPLRGTNMTSPDIRAGNALLLRHFLPKENQLFITLSKLTEVMKTSMED